MLSRLLADDSPRTRETLFRRDALCRPASSVNILALLGGGYN